jgi:hypothetical protein
VRLGDHVHVRFFSGKREDWGHGKNGDLCFRVEEWESFQRCFNDHFDDHVTIILEDGKP